MATRVEIETANKGLRIALGALCSQAFQVTRVCPDYRPAREALHTLMLMGDEALRQSAHIERHSGGENV